MKIKRINQIDPVQFTGGLSFRALLESDRMGFSIMKNRNTKRWPVSLALCESLGGLLLHKRKRGNKGFEKQGLRLLS